MKLRRTILGVLTLGCILVLVLGLMGVFSGDARRADPTRIEDDGGVTLVAKGFRTEGPNWTLTAPEFTVNKDESLRLVQPELRVRRPSDSGEQHVTLTAQEGSFSQEPSRVAMQGAVRMAFTSDDAEALLTTESLFASPEEGTGRTEDALTLEVKTRDGRHVISGRDASFALNSRTVRIERDIRLEISGAAPMLPAGEASKDAKRQAEVTVVTAEGPCLVDGFQRTLHLSGDVGLTQGENTLRAGRVFAQFPEKGEVPDRFEAEGDVRFRVAGAEGSGARLVRLRAEESLTIEGRPAAIQQGVSRIESSRIELDTARNRVFVPDAGRLVMAQEGEGQEPAEARWSRLLRFDPDTHEAVLRGDVQFSRAGQVIHCQVLRVRFDETNRQVLECRAEGGVRVTGKIAQGADASDVAAQGNELVYDMGKDAAVLTGEASVRQGDNLVTGERIEFSGADSGMKVKGGGRMTAAAPEGREEKPYGVSWTGDMQFSRESQQARFRREVALDYGGQTLRADSLLVKLGSNNAIENFQATGNVAVEEPGRTMRADRVVAQIGPDNQLLGLESTGRVVIEDGAADSPTRRTLRAEKVVSKVGENNAVTGFEATGRVVLEEGGPADKGGRVMRADRVSVALAEDRTIRTFEATGRAVTLEEQNHIARGNHLTWDVATEQGALLGSPVELRQGPNRMFGERVEFSQRNGSVRMTSRHRVEGAFDPKGEGMNRLKLP